MKTALLILGLTLLATANAETLVGTGEAVLSGENQVPTVVVTDTTAVFTANATSKSITWRLEIYDAVNVTMAHIHLGNSTTNGPPIVYLVPGADAAKNSTLPQLDPPRSGSTLVFAGTFRPSDVGAPLNGTTLSELLSVFESNDAYVNVHTTEYPAGEVRGQLEWEE